MKPKKIKLNLNELKVQSFITDLDNRQKDLIKAGRGAWSSPPECPSDDNGGNCPSGVERCPSYYDDCASDISNCYSICFSCEPPCVYETNAAGVLG